MTEAAMIPGVIAAWMQQIGALAGLLGIWLRLCDRNNPCFPFLLAGLIGVGGGRFIEWIVT